MPKAPGARGAADGKGFLGMAVAEAAQGGLDEMAEASGLAVESVTQNGPAELAGVRAGDIVIALDGDPVRWRDAYENREAALAPGSRAVLTVRRGDAVSQVAVDVGARRAPRPFPPPGAFVEEKLAGIAVRGVPEARAKALGLRPGAGVEMVGFSTGSPWPGAGLEAGDVIVRARAKDLLSPRELLDTIAAAGPGGELRLEVIRASDKPREVDVPLRAPPRVRDLNLAYLFRYERDDPATDVELLFYCFRYRHNPKESRLNFLWLLSFAWAGDETLSRVR